MKCQACLNEINLDPNDPHGGLVINIIDDGTIVIEVVIECGGDDGCGTEHVLAVAEHDLIISEGVDPGEGCCPGCEGTWPAGEHHERCPHCGRPTFAPGVGP